MTELIDRIYDELVKEKRSLGPKGKFEVELDLKGNVLFATSDILELSGYNKEEIEVLSVWDVISEKDHGILLERFAARREGRVLEPVTIRLNTKGGKVVRIWVNTEPIIENGKPVRIRAFIKPMD